MGVLAADYVALKLHEFDLSTHLGLLAEGNNVLAVHGLNNIRESHDFFLAPDPHASACLLDQPINLRRQREARSKDDLVLVHECASFTVECQRPPRNITHHRAQLCEETRSGRKIR